MFTVFVMTTPSCRKIVPAFRVLVKPTLKQSTRRYSTQIDETDIALGSTNRLAAIVASVIERDNPSSEGN
jgi:hypothetical protein